MINFILPKSEELLERVTQAHLQGVQIALEDAKIDGDCLKAALEELKTFA